MPENMETATTMNYENEVENKYITKNDITFGAGAALGVLHALGTGWWGSTKSNWGVPYNESDGCINKEEVFLERSLATSNLEHQKEEYENKIQGQRELTQAFFDAYKRDVDNSFMLYKNQRDLNDALKDEIGAKYEALKQMNIDSSFQLYKNHRDDKDAIMAAIYNTNNCVNDKINKLENKVDVMAAIRPYQDALINAKIDKNALISDFNLHRRTCKMIEGQLVLPDNLISGYTSVNM